jgi:hypothetical protein
LPAVRQEARGGHFAPDARAVDMDEIAVLVEAHVLGDALARRREED